MFLWIVEPCFIGWEGSNNTLQEDSNISQDWSRQNLPINAMHLVHEDNTDTSEFVYRELIRKAPNPWLW